jgi:hypothetical protein
VDPGRRDGGDATGRIDHVVKHEPVTVTRPDCGDAGAHASSRGGQTGRPPSFQTAGDGQNDQQSLNPPTHGTFGVAAMTLAMSVTRRRRRP